MADETVGDVGEFGLIERVKQIVGDRQVVVGIGDDAAVLDQPGDEYLLATTDMLVQDVHFRSAEITPFELGRRALAVNLSDIAAMGGEPNWALTSLALPSSLSSTWVQDLYRGLEAEAERFGVAVAGGNLSSIEGPIVIDITLLGKVRKNEVVLRSGAQVGDILAITGSLGKRGAVEPRVTVARSLAEAQIPHAMIDVSDGLAADAAHLAAASRAGAVIEVERLPLDEHLLATAHAAGQDSAELGLGLGEDYELLIALERSRLEEAKRLAGPVPLTEIGRVVETKRGLLLYKAGEELSLEPTGWRHF